MNTMTAYVPFVEPGTFSGLVNAHGANEGPLTSYEQQDIRPAIDDVICHYLDGSTLKNALEFIDYVRASKMRIKWSAVNVWSVRYRNKHVLDIIVREGTWRVRLVFDHITYTFVFSKHEREKIGNMISTLRYKIPENLDTIPALS